MEPSSKFFDELIKYEGLKLKAYLDSASIPTIGIGTIRYPNGKAVKMGDICTREQAYEYARHDLAKFTAGLNKLFGAVCVNQNQFDAMLLLMYNIGQAGFAKSTVLKLVKENTTDPAIKAAWMQWNKARVKGVLQVVRGLTIRRAGEYKLYTS